jgi:hypothetical protein
MKQDAKHIRWFEEIKIEDISIISRELITLRLLT